MAVKGKIGTAPAYQNNKTSGGTATMGSASSLLREAAARKMDFGTPTGRGSSTVNLKPAAMKNIRFSKGAIKRRRYSGRLR